MKVHHEVPPMVCICVLMWFAIVCFYLLCVVCIYILNVHGLSVSVCLYVCPGTMVVPMLTDLDLCGFPSVSTVSLCCIRAAWSHGISTMLVCTFDLYIYYMQQYTPNICLAGLCNNKVCCLCFSHLCHNLIMNCDCLLGPSV